MPEDVALCSRNDKNGEPCKHRATKDGLCRYHQPANIQASKCTGKSTRTGKPCNAYSVAGTTVCVKHGGQLINVKTAAARRVAETKAERKALASLGRQGYAPIEDPVEAISDLAGEAVARKDQFAKRLDQLLALDEIRYKTHTGEQLRAEVALYERALDRCLKILEAYVRLGIAERKQKINEAQAQVIVGVIQVILMDLSLTQDQKRKAAVAVPKALMAVAEKAD